MTQPWYATAYDERYYQTYKNEFSAQQTAEETEGIIRLLHLNPGARILDLCCGFGRHSIEMARRGYHVTGMDLSPDLLRHAGEASQAAGVEVKWVHADMRDIPDPETPYDAVINLFSSFGFFGDDREEAHVIASVYRVLAPNGQLLIETVNREVLLRHWMPLRWREQPDGVIICDKLGFDAKTGILHTEEIAIQTDGTRVRDRHQLRLWAYTELRALLTAKGFETVTVAGGLDESDYTRASYRMAVIGQRSQ